MAEITYYAESHLECQELWLNLYSLYQFSKDILKPPTVIMDITAPFKSIGINNIR
jgi:hypothetical protein